jgi:3-hydroxybutyryl-CoA dehydrogenase
MSVSTIGILGAGIMGSAIAQVAATKGLHVVLLDVGNNAVRKGLSRLATKGKMTASDADAALQRIEGTTSYDALKSVGVVIEAANENLDLKTKILKQVDRTVDAETIIASNTSSLSITKLASTISHPGRFVGLHFFNPVPAMALIEIVWPADE